MCRPARSWQQPVSTEGWVKKMWCPYAVQWYSARKESGLLPLATPWVSLESIMLKATVRQVRADTVWCPWFVQSNTQNQWSNTPKSNRLIDTGRKRGLPSPLLSYQKSDAFGLSILDTWGESAMAELSLTASHTLHPPCLAWNIAVLSVFSRNCLMFHVGWCSVCSRARFHDTVPGTGVMRGWILRRIHFILELWVS